MFLATFGGSGFEVFPVGDSFVERGQGLDRRTMNGGEGQVELVAKACQMTCVGEILAAVVRANKFKKLDFSPRYVTVGDHKIFP